MLCCLLITCQLITAKCLLHFVTNIYGVHMSRDASFMLPLYNFCCTKENRVVGQMLVVHACPQLLLF
uniref:Secreted protein n=1 Tax=Oryza brachyantha TaxID=4533 RepID=J3MRZ8_ORYBR